MTSVTMVTNDSAALHTSKTADNRSVKEAQGYPATQTVKEHDNATAAPQQEAKHNQRQRRKHERRQQQKPVLLDTRSGHDRRNINESQTVENEDTRSEQAAIGIDIYT